jgi:hypothetical protein
MDLAPDFDQFCALLSARKGDLDILVRPTEE